MVSSGLGIHTKYFPGSLLSFLLSQEFIWWEWSSRLPLISFSILYQRAMELSIVLLTIFTTVIDPADDFKDVHVNSAVRFLLHR